MGLSYNVLHRQPIEKEIETDAFVTRFEKMPLRILGSSSEGSLIVARRIADLIKERSKTGRNAVLGLATGSTPLNIYRELVRMHRDEGLSFSNVTTFNLDEYYPILPTHIESYNHFMHEHLFRHIDIKPENINIPRGDISREQVAGFCREYEQKIAGAGGIDIQILGIGRTGHIGFNEPGSSFTSKTRLVTLDRLTRVDAADAFNGEENVPHFAITMGIGTIIQAREIYLLAWGEGKAEIIQKAVEGPVTDLVPSSFLQNHANTTIILDMGAAAELTRFKTPWLVGSCKWDDRMIRQAVLWLCMKAGKPILKLTERDYNDNGLSELITDHGPFSKININVFNDLQHTITGWPGGKPGVDDSTRPERALPYPKKVVIFSPHPDDDVISMGGTFARLVEQHHDVHIGYQTSGSIAVADDDAIRYLDFVQDYEDIYKTECHEGSQKYHEILEFYRRRKKDTIEPKELLELKAAIRRGEARASCRYIGLPEENVHFLNLPFYETGTVKKNPAGEADVIAIMEFLRAIKPHQIYAAGDLSDPHGTHRVCIDIILEALDRMKDDPWIDDCRVWLYRGAWQEWELDKVDMAVPLSPEEVEIKRYAIFKHQSQKDGALFMGSDKREFWQRAEERNKNTAKLYDKLGMAEYEAIEVFVRYDVK
ncbi:MAG TPA: glucosamine-6-phosphate deaminase [Bacteroidales bacterium]|nr:glucosamine-6-phosphate deaminase [Bacteroidales bacterium]HPT01977.1 glucosamine-6-phosphate deaminase [Bacteroidales bacterium]